MTFILNSFLYFFTKFLHLVMSQSSWKKLQCFPLLGINANPTLPLQIFKKVRKRFAVRALFVS